MKPTLKELLKPPFRRGIGISGEVYVGVNKVRFNDTRIMQIKDWGFFQYFENGERLQDEFKDFVVQALNEEWERDYGEPLRWNKLLYSNGIADYICPVCKDEVHAIQTNFNDHFDYCPHCGRRFLPPKEEKDEKE